MLRILFVRFILPLIAFLVLRAVLKSVWGSLNQSSSGNSAGRVKTSPGGELKRDPVCGTYVAEGVSVTRKVNGQTVHFCSPACRDKYPAA